jgi:hypothetical protein
MSQTLSYNTCTNRTVVAVGRLRDDEHFIRQCPFRKSKPVVQLGICEVLRIKNEQGLE